MRKSGVALGKANVIIDTSAEEALAWRWDYCSNEKMKIHVEDYRNSIARLVVKEVCRNEIIISAIKRLPFPFHSREFVIKCFYTKENDSAFLFCWESVNDADAVDYGFRNKSVRGYSKGFMTLTNFGNRQCEVLFVQKLISRGSIPLWLGNMKIKDSLSIASELVNAFSRDNEIDEKERFALIDTIGNEAQEYSDEENKKLDTIEQLFHSKTTTLALNWQPVASSDPFTVMAIVDTDGKSNVTSRAEAVIDADVKTVVAYEFLTGSRQKMKEFYFYGVSN